jgi:hypothetical protein
MTGEEGVIVMNRWTFGSLPIGLLHSAPARYNCGIEDVGAGVEWMQGIVVAKEDKQGNVGP